MDTRTLDADTPFAPPVGQVPTTPAATAPVGTPVGAGIDPTVVVPVTPLEPLTAPRSAAPTQWTLVDTHRRVSPSAIVATAASVVLLLWGAVVLARAGLGGRLDTPVVEVTGYSATAVLGLVVAGVGLLLLVAALSRHRGAIVLVAVLAAVGAATLVIEPDTALRTLAGERDFGVAALIVLVITAVTAIVSPDVDWVARTERVD
jgi:hypothetical protein